MIVHDLPQGSPEWHAIRTGIPTASNYEKILTARTRKPSASATPYLYKLLVGYIFGPQDEDDGGSLWMARGTSMEPQARAWYEWDRSVDVEQVGFVTTDDGRTGGSPDGLVESDGIIEIKCYEAAHHLAALLEGNDDHAPQIQGLLWLTGRTWCDRIYYNPALMIDGKALVTRIERDDDYIADLSAAVDSFCERLAAAKQKLTDMGVKTWRDWQ